MTTYAKNFGGNGTLGPPGYACAMAWWPYTSTFIFLCVEMRRVAFHYATFASMHFNKNIENELSTLHDGFKQGID